MDYVIFGALRDQLYMAYTVISVYTQIISSMPITETLFVSPIPNNVLRLPVELRELMRSMQFCVIEASNLTQPSPHSVSVDRDILQLVGQVRRPIDEIDRSAAAIENDVTMKTVSLPGLKGKSAARIASEIREYMFDANQVLTFAQVYALRLKRKPSA